MAVSAGLHDHVASGHVVQLYGSDSRPLINTVSRMLANALRRGDGALVVATPEHRKAIYRKLWTHDISPFEAEQEHRLLLLDAGKTMAQFMVAGRPDWDRFVTVTDGILGRMRPRGGAWTGFGEMVGMLWKAGRFAEAVHLEHFWNRRLEGYSFDVVCGYPVDVFAPNFHSAEMDAVLRSHSMLLPTSDKIESVLHRAMDEVLGPLGIQVRELFLKQLQGTPSTLPNGEALVRWLRAHMTDDSDKILKRARRHLGKPHLTS